MCTRGQKRLENYKRKRLGEVNKMNCGATAIIIEYNKAKDIKVKILETNEIINTTYGTFITGKIKSKFYPTVCGVGYLGDLEIDKDSYNCWQRMIYRCFSEEFKNNNITYKNCKVCDEWLCYSDFKEWYDKHYYEIEGENIHLDKDILIKGNKIYSPETCVFVPENINKIVELRANDRGEFPIGVYKCKNNKNKPYQAHIKYKDDKNHTFLGSFETVEEAFNCYKKAKENEIKRMADYYKDKIPNKLYNALYNWEVLIND